jgi:hypothetical protein
MEPTAQSNLFELQIDHNSTQYLRDAARWGQFLAVVGFIFIGLFVVAAIIFATVLSNAFNSMGSASAAMSGGIIAVVCIIYALIYFFPCLYLYNFSSRMQVALRSNDQDQLNISFRNLRALYRFLGILLIIGLGLWVLAIIISVIGAAMR